MVGPERIVSAQELAVAVPARWRALRATIWPWANRAAPRRSSGTSPRKERGICNTSRPLGDLWRSQVRMLLSQWWPDAFRHRPERPPLFHRDRTSASISFQAPTVATHADDWHRALLCARHRLRARGNVPRFCPQECPAGPLRSAADLVGSLPPASARGRHIT